MKNPSTYKCLSTPCLRVLITKDCNQQNTTMGHCLPVFMPFFIKEYLINCARLLPTPKVCTFIITPYFYLITYAFSRSILPSQLGL